MVVEPARAATCGGRWPALGDEVARDEDDGLELWSRGRRAAAAGDTGRAARAGSTTSTSWPSPQSKHLTDPERAIGRRGRGRTSGWCCRTACVAGSWGRTAGATGVTVQVDAARRRSTPAGLRRRSSAYGAFLGLPATLVLEG